MAVVAPVAPADAAAQKIKKKKIPYPHTEPLKEVPADWKKAIHKPLGVKDFEAEHIYLRMKQAEFQRRADKYGKLAEDSQKYGNAETRKKKQRFDKLAQTMAQLKEQLLAGGDLSESDLEESLKSFM